MQNLFRARPYFREVSSDTQEMQSSESTPLHFFFLLVFVFLSLLSVSKQSHFYITDKMNEHKRQFQII